VCASSVQFPVDIDKEIETAVTLHNSGDLERAGQIYRHILSVDPSNSDALHLLGVISRQMGKDEEAERLISEAIRSSPHAALYHTSLGDLFKDNGRTADAVACYRKALNLDPSCAQAQANVGLLYEKGGRMEEAIQCYRKALELNPSLVEVYRNLCRTLKGNGQVDEAIKCLEKAVRLNPGAIALWTDLGNSYFEQMRLEEATACYQKTIDLDPNCAGTRFNLGNALRDQGRFREAISSYRIAVNLDPNYAEAYNNMGTAFYAQGELQKAVRCFEQALKTRNDYPDAVKNMGLSFEKQGLIQNAIDCYRLALSLNPADAGCHSGLLFAMHYDTGLTAADIFSESQVWWRQHGAVCRPIGVSSKKDPDPSKRLSVGYVSPDFREHSVSYFFVPLLERHSKAIETFCYADVKRSDQMTTRLKGRADHWHSIVGMTDSAVARRIIEDRIDILVDLAGHTTNNRLLVFARRPAPVQVTWLGYPNTTGMSVMDYRLTDDIADPVGKVDRYHTERLVRLPQGFLCYAPPEGVGEVSDLPALNRGRVTFASFNNLPKVNEKVVAVWSRILRRVAGSSLLLKSKSLIDKSVRRRYLGLFSMYGISANRIQFEPYSRTAQEHLSLYSRVDIGLDPFPYSGTTTTCEALWMGVPVVTLKGDRHSARVGASILTLVGLEDLIAVTEEKYVKQTVELATDLNKLASLRMSMRRRMKESPLCDAGSFARKMETMYKEIWHQWCAESH
jgi:protein O-GlcNAc transferase